MKFPSASWLRLALAALLGAALVSAAPAAKKGAKAKKAKARSRTFRFTYAATVTGLDPGQTARIWLPVPPDNDEQDVKVESKSLPGKWSIKKETVYGNLILFVEARANTEGKVPLSVTYKITRREVRTKGKGVTRKELEKRVKRYLQADSRVPVGGKTLALLKGQKVPTDRLRAGRLLYDVVNDHMTYAKDTPGWGNGDAEWACKSGRGNCSDFHSLFIALARARRMPAKFEIGFPLPGKRGAGEIPGYHCWAWFMPKKNRWVPVDISEANKNPMMKNYYFGNLTSNRVLFSTGRDLTLVPKQDGPALNFFIYPYVEVNRKPYDAAKVQKKFSYKDLKGSGRGK
jgi:transglutaminase-like putative cysteine protease